MSLVELYQEQLEKNGMSYNPAQVEVLHKMEQQHADLAEQEFGLKAWLRVLIKKLKRFFATKDISNQGIYLWGDVGCGKTYLLDLFFHSLPMPNKQRYHYHRFMRMVHTRLNDLSSVNKGKTLGQIAKELSVNKVVLIDEFMVKDIADAMLLYSLLKQLLLHDVVLLLSSNVQPNLLYKGGLQRGNFLPAIALLERKLSVICLQAEDYRYKFLSKEKVYHYPLDPKANQAAEGYFMRFASNTISTQDLLINGRAFKVIKFSDKIIWFTFAELCSKACGQVDYIEIAEEFSYLVLTQVPSLLSDDTARRFINLVDELYDRKVKLFITAEGDVSSLYNGQIVEFKRTLSRLNEMQAEEYLKAPHI